MLRSKAHKGKTLRTEHLWWNDYYLGLNHSSSCSRKSIWLGTPQFIRLQDNQTKSSESGMHDLYVMIKFQIINLAVFTARSEILLYVLIQITFYSETSCCWVEKLNLGHFMIISWFWVTFMDWEYPHNMGRMAYVTWGGCDLIFHYPWRNTPFPRKKAFLASVSPNYHPPPQALTGCH